MSGAREPRAILPPHGSAQRIGLFGGSFNPPHEAHRAASLLALKRLQLDWVWWLVSPGNPLKDTRALPPLAERMTAAREVADHPRIVITDIEAALGTRFTVHTLGHLRGMAPQARFVWIMGADNFVNFHYWERWTEMLTQIPIAVVDRAGSSLGVSGRPAGERLARWRVPEHHASILPDLVPPAWVWLHGLKLAVSSTALRTRKTRLEGVESAPAR